MNRETFLANLAASAGVPSAEQGLYLMWALMLLFVGLCIGGLVWQDAHRARSGKSKALLH